MRTTMLAALAALIPCAAVADGATPLAANDIPVDPTRSVSGSFSSPGTQAWRVYLRAGRYYAVSATETESATVTVRAAGGKSLALFDVGSEDVGGAGFRAPYTGLYSVEVTCGEAGDPCVTPSSYTLSAGRDCPGDLSTSCTIAVGQTLHNLWLSSNDDADAFRTRLVGGVAYTVNLPVRPGGGATYAAVLDARGRTLAASDALFRFTAPGSGTYYVVVSGGDGGIGFYDLSLSR